MADLTLAVSGVGSTGQVALIGAPGLVALTLPTPRPTISGVGAVPLVQATLPTPGLSVSGVTGVSAQVQITQPSPVLAIYGPPTAALTLPTPVLAASGVVGRVGSVAVTLPSPLLFAASPSSAQLKLPTPVLQISGGVGVVGSVSLNLPVPQLAVVTQVPYTAKAALNLPVPQLAVAGVTGVAGSVAVTMRGLALAVGGGTGVIGQMALTLPMSVFSAGGYEATSGVVQLVLPHLQLVATGSGSAIAPASTASNTIAMHTEQMGLTTYSNFPFNSFAAFNGVYLAASPSGIFTLGGDNDNGAIIQAAARVGMTDFATSHLKRVDRVYVGYRTDGNLVLRVFTDEVNQRDYLLTQTGKTGLHGNHLRIGKGLAARYWQFEVRNQNGADFQLNAIELKPTPLRRRVGGGDA